LNLLAESASHSAVFFSHNKSANSTFCHGLSAKQGSVVSFFKWGFQLLCCLFTRTPTHLVLFWAAVTLAGSDVLLAVTPHCHLYVQLILANFLFAARLALLKKDSTASPVGFKRPDLVSQTIPILLAKLALPFQCQCCQA
jgi:hypothetical protein